MTNISRITKNNQILTDPQEICRIWEEYIRNLFDDTHSVTSSNISSNASGPPIIDLEHALSTFKIGKHQEKTRNMRKCSSSYSNTGKSANYLIRSMTPALFLWIG